VTVALRYVSSSAKLELQSWYNSSTAFAAYTSFTDRAEPPLATNGVESITLQVSPWNVVDIDADAWLPTWITNYSADALLSQVAINATIFPPAGATPGTVLPP